MPVSTRGTKSEQNVVVLHLFQVRVNTSAHSCYFDRLHQLPNENQSCCQGKKRFILRHKRAQTFSNVTCALSIGHVNWVISIAESMAEMRMLKNLTLSFPKTRNFYISKLTDFVPTLQQLNFWTTALDSSSWEHTPWSFPRFCKNRSSSISDPGNKIFFLIHFQNFTWFFHYAFLSLLYAVSESLCCKLIRPDLMLLLVLHLDIEPASCCVCSCPTGISTFCFQSLKDITDRYLISVWTASNSFASQWPQ